MSFHQDIFRQNNLLIPALTHINIHTYHWSDQKKTGSQGRHYISAETWRWHNQIYTRWNTQYTRSTHTRRMLILPSDLWTYFNRGSTALFGVQPVGVQIPHVCEFQWDKLFDSLGEDLQRNLYTRMHNFEVLINIREKKNTQKHHAHAHA